MTGPADLAARMPQIAVALLGEPNGALSNRREWRWGRKGSLAIDPARGVWWDHEAGLGGGVFDLVARAHGGNWEAARRWLGDGAIALPLPIPALPQGAPADDEARRARALALWREARPAADSPAAAYLASRGLGGILKHPELAPVLRYAPACPFGPGQRLPAMLSLLVTVHDGQPRAVRRTALLPDGRRALDDAGAKLPHKALGPAGGALVKLTGPATPGGTLAVCEGVETGLSLLAAGVAPIWACTAAGTLGALPVLPGVGGLVVFADNDPPGLVAARNVARRWQAAGRDAVVRMPERPGDDFNDVWREARNAA